MIIELTQLLNQLKSDLSFYMNKPKSQQKQFVINKLESQIRTVEKTINHLNTIQSNIDQEIQELKVKLQNQDDEFFKREACSFYHGCSLPEITRFINRPINIIHEEINECIRLKTRQTPFYLLDYLDKEKQEAAWDKITININNKGQVEYNQPEPPPVKYATKPVLDWKNILKTNH